MPVVLVILVSAILVGCGTYKGYEVWRRDLCDRVVDADERARCLEDATRSENDYKHDVEEATGD